MASPPPKKSSSYVLPRNERGGKFSETHVTKNSLDPGIALTDEEISAAFEFFDAKGTGELNPQDLRERMGMFIPSLSMRECKLLVSSEGPFTKDKLKSLLQDNELSNFDPIAEAFKVFTQKGGKYLDMEILRKMLAQVGYNNLSDDDIDVLLETADVDKDGKVSIDDFAAMVNHPWVAPTLFPDAAESRPQTQGSTRR